MPRPERTPRAVDWDTVRGRLARAALGPEDAPEAVQAVLEARARALARPPVAARDGERVELLTFALGSERYGVESRYVQAVFALTEVCPIPGAPAPVSGVTAWRGDLLVLLDLRGVLGVPADALHDLSQVLVLGADRPAFGILTDAVRDVVTFPADDVRAPPDGAATRGDVVRGVTGDAVSVLDGSKLLHLYG